MCGNNRTSKDLIGLMSGGDYVLCSSFIEALLDNAATVKHTAADVNTLLCAFSHTLPQSPLKTQNIHL